MSSNFEPFTDLRTGKRIHSVDEEIAEYWYLTHLKPKGVIEPVQTKYGLWLCGSCPACEMPVNNWDQPHFCGHCGVFLNWKEIEKTFNKE